jgi:hypothetical protein
MQIEAGKKYRTRNNQKVWVKSTDGRHKIGEPSYAAMYPVYGAIWDVILKKWQPLTWTAEGMIYNFSENHKYDLICTWAEDLPNEQLTGA